MRRDFEEYLIKVQKQFTEMSKALEEANQLLAEGKISQEAANSMSNYYNNLNTNYQRLLYCRYLYNLPPKFIQKLQKKKLERKTKEFVKELADKDTIIKENQENLDAFKSEVDSVKEPKE